MTIQHRARAAAWRKARELEEHCRFHGLQPEEFVAHMVAGTARPAAEAGRFGAAEYDSWRRKMGDIGHAQAAALLRITERTSRNYSRGGGARGIPLSVALACATLLGARAS